MRYIKHFIVHCSATPNDRDIRAANIRRWHVEENGWSDIGYHYVITRGGVVEAGRPLDKAGAHVAGRNSDSIGVCMVGNDQFTDEQYVALRNLHTVIKTVVPEIEVSGHRDWTNAKTCPNFDAKEFLS